MSETTPTPNLDEYGCEVPTGPVYEADQLPACDRQDDNYAALAARMRARVERTRSAAVREHAQDAELRAAARKAKLARGLTERERKASLRWNAHN